MLLRTFMWESVHVLSFLGMYPSRYLIAGSYGNSLFSILKNCHTFQKCKITFEWLPWHWFTSRYLSFFFFFFQLGVTTYLIPRPYPPSYHSDSEIQINKTLILPSSQIAILLNFILAAPCAGHVFPSTEINYTI